MNLLLSRPVTKANPNLSPRSNVIPVKTNIIRFEDRYELQLAVPGFQKGELTVQSDRQQLIIVGHANPSGATSDHKYHRREFNLHDFRRVFSLGEDIDETKIDAVHADGILTVVLPVKQKLHREIAVS